MKQNERTERALLAERCFGKNLKDFGHQFFDEIQQRQRQVGQMTPDFLFPRPTLINGHLCMWVEYKDYVGFRSNPYGRIARKKAIQEI